MKNKIYVSPSGFNDYTRCPELFYLKKVERLESIIKGSSLFFGDSIDNTINYYLNNLLIKNTKKINDLYEYFKTDKNKGWDNYYDHTDIRYSNTDFDMNILSDDKIELIQNWCKEFSFDYETLKTLKKDYSQMTQQEITLFNRICWLCLQTKAYYMIEWFLNNFAPKIKKVRAVQLKINGEIDLPVFNNEQKQAVINQITDFVIDFEGIDKPVIFDLKTSSSEYDSDAVQTSFQLGSYVVGLWNQFQTDQAGFVVLHKYLKSKALCKSCGFEKQSTHKTCNNEINNKRCGGEWDKSFEGSGQVIVDTINEQKRYMVNTNYTNFSTLASMDLRVQNWNACKKPFLCDMFEVCHHNDMSKVKKRS